MLVGEDFAQGAVVLVGHPAVGEDIVEIVEKRVAGGTAFRPFVFVGSVVEDEIDDGGNACFVQRGNDIAQVVYRTQSRIDVAVAADRIAAVTLAFRAFKQRHHVQIGQPQLLKIRDFGFQAFQIACEQIDIAHAADLFIGQNPIGVILTCGIDGFQRLVALGIALPCLGNQLFQHGQDGFVVVVNVVQLVHQLGEMLVQTPVKLFPVFGSFDGRTLFGAIFCQGALFEMMQGQIDLLGLGQHDVYSELRLDLFGSLIPAACAAETHAGLRQN